MNSSGIHPQGDRVLVRVETIEETTEGGIVIPKTELQRHEMAQIAGILVDHGVDAWSDYAKPFAEVGQRVLYQRHSGIQLTGKDGELYRMVNDTDIIATLDEGVSFHEFANTEKRIAFGEN
jgi:chaperonin GroES